MPSVSNLYVLSLLVTFACGTNAGGPPRSSDAGAPAGGQASAGAALVGGAGKAPGGGGSVGESGGSVGGSAGGVFSDAGSAGQGGASAGRGSAGFGAGGSGSAGEAAACPFGSSEYFLWAGAAPGSTAGALVERFTDRSTSAASKDRSVTGVSKPSLFAFLAQQSPAAAVIILPGGGYTHLAWDKEGIDIASWFNTQGVSAFVLKYRLPADFPGSSWIPLADAQRALRAVRQNARACGIDASKIGVIGFSAGGHLASQLITRSASLTYPVVDAIDAVDARPSFGVLMYPVVSMDAAIAHSGSKTALLGANPTPAEVALYSSELHVTSATPSTFVATSSKDTTVKPENSVRFDDALKAKGVVEELHLYQDGAHGTGIRDAKGDMAAWPTQCAAWLKAQKFL